MIQFEDLPFVLRINQESAAKDYSEVATTGFRAGVRCPVCRIGHLGYNSIFNLECERCKHAVGGCFIWQQVRNTPQGYLCAI